MIRALAICLALATQAGAHEFPFEVERVIDADTFDGTIDLAPLRIQVPVRIRLMCINAPESRGQRKSPEGVAMSEAVKSLGIERGRVELHGRDAFGRYLAFFRPQGFDQSLNRFLFRSGAPLYGRLTRAERAMCEARLQ